MVESDLVRSQRVEEAATQDKDTLNQVRDGLLSVWDTQGRRFVTFEPDRGRGDGDDAAERWVQYLDGVLNLVWPLDEEPATALPRLGVALPPGAFVAFSAPGGTAQIAVGDVLLDDVAALVVALCEHVVAPGAAGRLTLRVEDFG